ncbi:unnamed protein product [Laminaria digitata]
MTRDTPSSPSAAQGRNGLIDGVEQDWYLLLCVGGLQAVVKTEVERHFKEYGRKVSVQVFQEDCQGSRDLVEGVHTGQAGCGKLLLATDAPPEVLNNLRCVQGFFALVAHATSLDIVLPATPDTATSRQEGDAEPVSPDPCEASTTTPQDPSPSSAAVALARVESLVTESVLWPAALNLWKQFHTLQTGALPTNMGTAEQDRPGKEHDDAPTDGLDLEALKFRASVVRDGRHPFNSVAASPRLGEAVSSVNRGWSVDLKEYDVEVTAFILARSVVVGLSLNGDRTKRCSNGRVPKEDKGFIETGLRMSSLRPSTAYVMLGMAAPSVGDVVVDCMCGVGTIPFLGAGWFPDAFLMGGEVDMTALEHVRQNAEALRLLHAKPEGAVAAAACAWDAQLLPLRDGIVDVMVVDMPFGLSCGSPRVNAKLYPTVMAEMARALRPGTGRAVLLVTQPHLLGLPEIQRERPKDKKKKRFKGTRRPHEGGSNKPSESEGNDGKISKPTEQSEGRGGKVSCADVAADRAQQQAEERLPCKNEGVGEQGSRDLKPSAPEGVAGGAAEGGTAVAPPPPPPPLWQLRARHAVNIGGLVSWLLILGRTDEPPPPPPRSDRRNRFVGLKSYCKRREDGRLVS